MGAYELLGGSPGGDGRNFRSLSNSDSLSSLRLTEVMEYAISMTECDTVHETPSSTSSSLGRSLGGLFGLGGGTNDHPTAGVTNVMDEVRLSEMRVAMCPVKIQWAMLLADLGLLRGASAYAKEVKRSLINRKQGTTHALIKYEVVSLGDMNLVSPVIRQLEQI